VSLLWAGVRRYRLLGIRTLAQATQYEEACRRDPKDGAQEYLDKLAASGGTTAAGNGRRRATSWLSRDDPLPEAPGGGVGGHAGPTSGHSEAELCSALGMAESTLSSVKELLLLESARLAPVAAHRVATDSTDVEQQGRGGCEAAAAAAAAPAPTQLPRTKISVEHIDGTSQLSIASTIAGGGTAAPPNNA
jgi:hypothetical protein